MEVSDVVRSLLKKRGISDEKHIDAFLRPDYEAHLHSPALLSGMAPALERLFFALEKGERVAVYADYDADGIGAAAILSGFFKKVQHENVEVYLPHRDKEGYGFHVAAVEQLALRGTKLIITADVGISGTAAAARARALGVETIITDHHEVMHEIPSVAAVVNPKLENYPFPHLCGAAVAWKLVQAALAEGKRRGLSHFAAIPNGWEKWLLDLVAISSISDMVPLIGENRVLVHWGLQVLRKSPRPGIRALCEVARIDQRSLSEDDVGFSICPRINAASRMDEPSLAYELLTTPDVAAAYMLAHKLEQLNAQRKGVVAGIVRQAKARARERFAPEDDVAVLGDTSWKPSLLGLAANSLVAERGGVVCLWGRDAAGNLKGSCRSDGAFSLVDIFANAGDALQEYGGHAHSGGFTVSPERVHTLHDALSHATKKAARASVSLKEHDLSLPLSSISHELLADISRLSPFGIGNPKPIFLVPEASVLRVKKFGKEQNHIEVMLECTKTGRSIRAFEFFKDPQHFTQPPVSGASASILATLERDTYRGPRALALRIVDVLPSC